MFDDIVRAGFTSQPWHLKWIDVYGRGAAKIAEFMGEGLEKRGKLSCYFYGADEGRYTGPTLTRLLAELSKINPRYMHVTIGSYFDDGESTWETEMKVSIDYGKEEKDDEGPDDQVKFYVMLQTDSAIRNEVRDHSEGDESYSEHEDMVEAFSDKGFELEYYDYW
jgi:hypothetical protein